MTLRADGPGGTLKPAVSTADVRFSAGGSGPMVTWTEAGEQFTMSWPGRLPTPRIDGATAVYANVFTDVDLHVTATLDGFTHVLEVKTPAAAANPAVRSVRFATAGNLKIAETADGLELRDPSGKAVASSQGALMWDSGTAAAPDMMSARGMLAADGDTPADVGEPASAEASGDGSRTAPVLVDADATGLTVTADAQLLASGTYPIFIDPPFRNNSVLWAYATSNGENNDATYARVGKMPDNAQARYRSYWSFPTTGLPGTQILSARVDAKLQHSSSCDDTPVYAYSTSSITVAHKQRMAWTDRALPNNNYAGSWSGSANKSSCPQPDADAVFDDAEMVTQVQATATAGWSVFVLGLCACDNNGNGESDTFRWKKFYIDKTFLNATFDLPPYKPVGLGFVDPDCYQQCALPALVNTATPTLQMAAKDPYGGTLVTCFEVRTAASDTAPIVITNTSARVTTSTPGTAVKDASPAKTAAYKIPTSKLSHGSTYYWRATTYDENSLWSGWSPWYQFTVDDADPATPSVASAKYPAKTWSGGINDPGTFTFTGDSQVHDFIWSIDGGSTTTTSAALSGATTTASMSYSPPTDMVHTVRVTAKDKAGNISPAFDYQFWVKTVATSYAHWKLDEVAGVTTAAVEGTAGNGTTGTLKDLAAFSTGGKFGNAAYFSGAGGEVATAGPVLDTSKSFTVTAWAKVTNPGAGTYQTVLSQTGTNASRFQLYYRTDLNNNNGGWCFAMRATDSAAASTVSACSTKIPATYPWTNRWVHVAGVYDQPNNKIYVYVLGGSEETCFDEDGETATQGFSGTWTGTGAFVAGRAYDKAGGTTANHLIGGIDDVWAYQTVMPPAEICSQGTQ